MYVFLVTIICGFSDVGGEAFRPYFSVFKRESGSKRKVPDQKRPSCKRGEEKGLSSPAMRGPLPSITNYLKKIIITQAALVDRDVDRQVVSCSHDPFTLLLLPPPCHARHPATNVF